jgi:hypothetical protein
MNTKTAIDNGGEADRFTNHGQINNVGRGRGLANLGDALERAQVEASKFPAGADWGAGRPLWRRELVAAYYRGERDALGLIEAAAIEQAAEDVKLVANCLRALVLRIEDKGHKITEQQREEAKGAGVAALVEWRNGVRACPSVRGSRVVEAAAVVAWRAVSDELGKSRLGHSVEFSDVSTEWLADLGDCWAIVEPLAVACCAGLESRNDKAVRLIRERGAARRGQRLAGRLDKFRQGAHGRRVALVARIETAARAIINGASIDAAARAVGFKDRPGHWQQAGADLARAARACGIRFNLTQPAKKLSFELIFPAAS